MEGRTALAVSTSKEAMNVAVPRDSLAILRLDVLVRREEGRGGGGVNWGHLEMTGVSVGDTDSLILTLLPFQGRSLADIDECAIAEMYCGPQAECHNWVRL